MAKSKATPKSNVILKKDGNFELLYIKNCIMYYAKVKTPVDKYKVKGEKEYSVTIFVDADTKDQLEDLPVNKGFSEVGVDKIKKGANRGKIKYDLETYPDCEGLFGFTVSVGAKTKSGKDFKPVVVGADGKPLEDLIGNGSKGNIKCLVWKNQDEEYNLKLNLVHVTDLVEYEGGGEIEDDELGITYSVGGSDSSDTEEEEDDDIPPFDEDDDDY